jgi:hypothetical protein
VPPGNVEVVLIEEALACPKVEISQAYLIWIVGKGDPAKVGDAVVLAVSDELMEMRVAPAKGDLDGGVQLGDGCVIGDQQAAPDQRADSVEPDAELVDSRGALMKITVQVVIESGDGPAVVTEVATLARETLTDETLGLSLAEGKAILAQLQEAVVVQQAAAYIAQQQTCPQCGARRRCKGLHQIVIRSLFGKLTLSSLRLYTCGCQPADTPRSSPLAERLPERTTPELRYLEAKWAALLPYGVTVDVLSEVLPLHARVATVYRHTQQVAERLEGELGDEQPLKSRAASAIGTPCPGPMVR